MKNVQIEFWRAAFAAYMVAYHTLGHVYQVPTGGYIGVDVFAVIAGFFLASSHEKRKNMERGVTAYLAGRFIRLYPVYLSAYLISGLLSAARSNMTFMQAAERFYRSFPEMFMFRNSVISINGVAWYMSAMLIASLILWVFLSLDPGRKWMPGLLLVAALWIYGTFMQKQGRIHFTISQNVMPIGWDGVWRVFADMGMGVLAFSLVQHMRGRPQNKSAQRALRIAGNVGFALVLTISLFKYHGFCDFWFIFIIWCAVVCLMLPEQPPGRRSRVSKAVCYLGGLAYPVYLLHEAIFGMFEAYGWIANPALGCAAVLGITVLEAAFLDWLLKGMKEKADR